MNQPRRPLLIALSLHYNRFARPDPTIIPADIERALHAEDEKTDPKVPRFKIETPPVVACSERLLQRITKPTTPHHRYLYCGDQTFGTSVHVVLNLSLDPADRPAPPHEIESICEHLKEKLFNHHYRHSIGLGAHPPKSEIDDLGAAEFRPLLPAF